MIKSSYANIKYIIKGKVHRLTVAKSHIFRVLSSEAETSNFESDDHDTSDIPFGFNKEYRICTHCSI